MATIVGASSSTQVGTSVSSIAIAKPSGLAAGDLMIAVIGIVADGVSHPITAPAGWTDLGGIDLTGGFASNRAFYKLADGNDAAASTFTFSTSLSVAIMKGGIGRFTGGAQSVNPVDQTANSFSATASPSTGAITPTRAMGTLVMMTMSWNGGAGTCSVAGYNVATTNPTWTELFDSTTSFLSGNQAINVAMAYGGRSPITSTGAGGAAITGGSAYGIWLLDIVPEPLTITQVITTVLIPSVLIILLNGFTALCTMLGATVLEIRGKWRNAAKHSASWDNVSKSDP